MARGWESKNVESQQQEEEQAGARTRQTGPFSTEERERAQKRAALELSRKQVAGELATTKSETRRRSLEGALAHLDEELGRLKK